MNSQHVDHNSSVSKTNPRSLHSKHAHVRQESIRVFLGKAHNYV